MAVSSQCPQCGGQFELKVIGEMRDKHFVCPYCRHKVDILDEFETTTRESTRRDDGSLHTVEVTHRRRDVDPDSVQPSDAPEGLPDGFEILAEGGGKVHSERTLPDGTRVVEMELADGSKEQLIFTADGSPPDAEMLKGVMAGMVDTKVAADLAESFARVQQGEGAGDVGKEHTVERVETISSTTVSGGSLPDSMAFGSPRRQTAPSMVPWIIAVVAVALLVVVLVMR